jgi:hypothetical protein
LHVQLEQGSQVVLDIIDTGGSFESPQQALAAAGLRFTGGR